MNRLRSGTILIRLSVKNIRAQPDGQEKARFIFPMTLIAPMKFIPLLILEVVMEGVLQGSALIAPLIDANPKSWTQL